MATPLALLTTTGLDIIFVALLVFSLVYAILQKTGILGKAIALNAIVAVAVMFMVLLSDNLVKIINFMIPWFAIAIIFFILLILCFQVFGAGEKDISKVLGDKTFQWTIIGVGIVIMVAAFGTVFGPSLTQASFQGQAVNVTEGGGTATPSFEQNIYATLFHPKVLGMLILFAVAIFAIAFLTG
ncbi:hypothetical protein HYX14_04535 [Candidatus Woesearchaeota archaeon]|nr:hypothetical protein [Candidatus Woesearchaeota archaeon]